MKARFRFGGVEVVFWEEWWRSMIDPIFQYPVGSMVKPQEI